MRHNQTHQPTPKTGAAVLNGLSKMTVCEAVSKLASEVEEQLDCVNQSHFKMLSVMKRMLDYLAAGDLAAWEADYRSAMSDDEDEQSRNNKAIDLVYELTDFNLFGAFQESETRRIYTFVVNELKKMNIRVSGDLNVSKW